MSGERQFPRRGVQRATPVTGVAGVPSEAQALLDKYNINLNAGGPQFGASRQADDPLVYLGGNGETRRLSVMNQSFYGLSQEALVEFQLALVRAGRLDRVTGEHDDETYEFWQGVNERSARFFAAGRRRTPNEVLDDLSPVGTGEDEEPGRPGFIDTITSAASLEVQVQQAAKARLGRKLKRGEVARFVSVYQGLERRANQARNDAQLAATPDGVADGANSTVVAPPGADAAADQFIDSDFAQEAAGQDAYGYLNVLRSMIGGQ